MSAAKNVVQEDDGLLAHLEQRVYRMEVWLLVISALLLDYIIWDVVSERSTAVTSIFLVTFCIFVYGIGAHRSRSCLK